MTVYSKSGDAGICDFFNMPVKPLTDIPSLEQPLIFFYAFRDGYAHNISLVDALDLPHWHNLNKYSSSVFIYENFFEPTDYVTLASTVNDIIKLHNINPVQLYIIVADDVQEQYLKTELEKYNLSSVRTDYKSKCLLDTVIPQTFDQPITVKFSLMSRRYVLDRLLLLCELINNDLINEFSYSFHNANPYTNQITHIDITALPVEYQTVKIQDWINNMPYYINNSHDNWMEQFSNKMYNTILQSSIHIVVETIFCETIYGYNQDKLVPWITEKTFKAIACKKVFLCYGMPGTLKTLQQMGFKTFSSVIDESYDSIVDHTERRKALVNEIKRLSLLSSSELVSKLNDIVEYNFQLLKQKQNKQWHQDFLELGIFK
jgi:hypothetical protein